MAVILIASLTTGALTSPGRVRHQGARETPVSTSVAMTPPPPVSCPVRKTGAQLPGASLGDGGRHFDLAAGRFHPFDRARRIRCREGEEQERDRAAVASFVRLGIGGEDAAQIQTVHVETRPLTLLGTRRPWERRVPAARVRIRARSLPPSGLGRPGGIDRFPMVSSASLASAGEDLH